MCSIFKMSSRDLQVSDDYIIIRKYVCFIDKLVLWHIFLTFMYNAQYKNSRKEKNSSNLAKNQLNNMHQACVL